MVLKLALLRFGFQLVADKPAAHVALTLVAVVDVDPADRRRLDACVDGQLVVQS